MFCGYSISVLASLYLLLSSCPPIHAQTVLNANSPQLAYIGNWASGTFDGVEMKWSNDTDAQVSLTWTGDAITYEGATRYDRGRCTMVLDGTDTTVLDLYSTGTGPLQIMWSRFGLSSGSHTATLSQIGVDPNLGFYPFLLSAIWTIYTSSPSDAVTTSLLSSSLTFKSNTQSTQSSSASRMNSDSTSKTSSSVTSNSVIGSKNTSIATPSLSSSILSSYSRTSSTPSSSNFTSTGIGAGLPPVYLHSTSPGVIAAGVCGGASLLGALALGAFIFRRILRRQSAASKGDQSVNPDYRMVPGPFVPHGPSPPQMRGMVGDVSEPLFGYQGVDKEGWADPYAYDETHVHSVYPSSSSPSSGPGTVKAELPSPVPTSITYATPSAFAPSAPATCNSTYSDANPHPTAAGGFYASSLPRPIPDEIKQDRRNTAGAVMELQEPSTAEGTPLTLGSLASPLLESPSTFAPR